MRVKKYFYALRPVLACIWIEKYQKMPPTEFGSLVDSVLPEGLLRSEVIKLLMRKKAGDELDYGPKIKAINDFLDKQINFYDEYMKIMGKSVYQDEKLFNQVFRDALKEVWGS